MRPCLKHPTSERRKNGQCVMCHRAAVKASRAKNPEKYYAYHKAWEAENRAKINASHRKWTAANAERSRAIKKAWRERNPDRRNHNRRQYQLQKLRAMPAWADRAAILAIYKEASRLTAETGIVHQVDHIIPIKHPLVCGLHVPTNLQVLSASDNRKKSNSFSSVGDTN